jgi:hypothetical protein
MPVTRKREHSRRSGDWIILSGWILLLTAALVFCRTPTLLAVVGGGLAQGVVAAVFAPRLQQFSSFVFIVLKVMTLTPIVATPFMYLMFRRHGGAGIMAIWGAWGTSETVCRLLGVADRTS